MALWAVAAAMLHAQLEGDGSITPQEAVRRVIDSGGVGAVAFPHGWWGAAVARVEPRYRSTQGGHCAVDTALPLLPAVPGRLRSAPRRRGKRAAGRTGPATLGLASRGGRPLLLLYRDRTHTASLP